MSTSLLADKFWACPECGATINVSPSTKTITFVKEIGANCATCGEKMMRVRFQ